MIMCYLQDESYEGYLFFFSFFPELGFCAVMSRTRFWFYTRAFEIGSLSASLQDVICMIIRYLQDEGYVFIFLPWTGGLCCDEQEQGLFVY